MSNKISREERLAALRDEEITWSEHQIQEFHEALGMAIAHILHRAGLSDDLMLAYDDYSKVVEAEGDIAEAEDEFERSVAGVLGIGD